MYDQSIKLIEMPEHNCISVCVYIEQDGIFEFGERINQKFEEAYMNGYNWDALISYYISQKDPELASEIKSDPEAGMYSAYMDFNDANLEKMKKFEKHIKTMVSDESKLIKFISENIELIEWD